MALHLEETKAVTELFWKNYSAEITIAKDLFPKTFGPVKTKNHHYYRDYKRSLKNGKGLSFIDLIEIRMKNYQAEILRLLELGLF